MAGLSVFSLHPCLFWLFRSPSSPSSSIIVGWAASTSIGRSDGDQHHLGRRGALGPVTIPANAGPLPHSIFVHTFFLTRKRTTIMGRPISKRADALAEASEQRGRLAAAQADLAELKAAKLRGDLVEAAAVELEWSGILRTVRAGMLAVPSRVAARLPHLSKHDVAEIDAEIRAVLSEAGEV
ncbi:hypothetical protein H8A99_10370 [Bradyrhizobium sp. Arg68]|uniref:hypothetical protein n=1 Tax=Bradyrhizobium ivorense TaxID=2511166 RepID=UPI001E5479A9|nr:hypothetical protein [Bradyrhizobium ivorense]MCC8936879.1 hypothetical protein [Bradyrhizobium ivorense]